ncbi:MAG TPA: polyphenol oxidase family protein [Acidimicrobiales bacterium]|nr:polyphenol oxidase family protein [Acidimicrobiales bacterium]
MDPTPVEAFWSTKATGDQRGVDAGSLPSAVPAGLSVYRLRQVHGSDVVVAGAPPPPGTTAWATAPDGRAPDADAVVAVGSGSCLVVLTADCAPVALGSPDGVFGAVHVGWRGLVADVIGRAVDVMRSLGAGAVVAGLGPTIHRCCYAFGTDDLDAAAASAGDEVRGVTSDGAPALDLPAGVRAALDRAGVPLVVDVDRCTACGDDSFSYRARRDDARQGLFVWTGPSGSVM